MPEATPGQAVAAGQPHLSLCQPLPQVPQARPVVGIALVIAPVALQHAPVGGAVDIVDRSTQRRQAAGDEGLPQAVGGQREIGGHAEPAEALAENAPPLHPQLASDQLSVPHYRVCPEVGEMLSLLLGDQTRLAGEG